MGKLVTCKLCELGDVIDGDLDHHLHKGFTIGSGKTLYWYLVWTRNGNCNIYRTDGHNGLVRRFVYPDQEITVHFK